MKDLMFRSWVKAQIVKQNVKNKAHDIKEHLLSEEGGADTIIIAVIIILVVLVLGFVFKDYIVEWFDTLIGQADDQIKNHADINPTPPGGNGQA